MSKGRIPVMLLEPLSETKKLHWWEPINPLFAWTSLSQVSITTEKVLTTTYHPQICMHTFYLVTSYNENAEQD